MRSIITAIICCLSLAAQQLPLKSSGWVMNYAYQTKKTDMPLYNLASGDLTFDYPLSTTKSNPSKPNLTGEWAGYLQYSHYTAPFQIQPISLMPGKSITITGNITTTGTPVFNYQSESFNTCVSPASFRPYLEGVSSDNDGRWWSNQITILLQPGPFSIVVPIDPAYWSNVNGQTGLQQPDLFSQAISQVIKIGATNGGGCFYGHGVNVSGGTATLSINQYAVNQ